MTPAGAPPLGWTVRLGPLDIDVLRARVTKHGREVTLSTSEYRLVLLFALNPGRVFSSDALRAALWGGNAAYVESNTLYVYLRRLREKIEDDPARPCIIQTVRGRGYVGVSREAAPLQGGALGQDFGPREGELCLLGPHQGFAPDPYVASGLFLF